MSDKSLDEIVSKYESNLLSRLKSNAINLSKKVLKTGTQCLFWGYISWTVYMVLNFDNLRKKDLFIDNKVTEYAIQGLKRYATGPSKDIFFENKEAYLEIKRFIDSAHVHPTNIVESTDRKYLALRISKKEVKEALSKNEFKIAFGELDLEGLADSSERDIFILKKDGSEFYNITKRNGTECITGWQRDGVVFEGLGKNGNYTSLKARLSDRKIMDFPSKSQIYYNMLYLYLAGLGAGLGAVALYGSKRKRRNLRGNISTSIVENPELSTIAHAVAFSIGAYYLHDQITAYPDYGFQKQFWYSAYGMFTLSSSYVVDYFLKEFRKLKPPYMRNWIKYLAVLTPVFDKNPERNLRTIKKVSELMASPGDVEETMSLLHIDAKERGKGFKLLERGFEKKIEGRSRKRSAFEKIIILPMVNQIENIAGIISPYRVTPKVGRISYSLTNSNYPLAFRRWDELTDISNNKGQIGENLVELNCLYSIFIESFSRKASGMVKPGDDSELSRLRNNLETELGISGSLSELLKKKSKKQWKKTIDLIISDPNSKKSRFTSGNVVYSISNNNFLEGTLVFKESDKPFDKEKEIRDRLEKIVDDSVMLPRPVADFKYDKFYYVMRREEGETLTAKIKSKTATKEMYDIIIETLAKIHVLFPLETLNYPYDMKSRLENGIKKAAGDSAAERYVQHCKPILEVLSNSKNMCYNKDSSSENWMITKEGKIVLLDTEDKGIVPYALDISNLLNFITPLPLEKRLKKVEFYIKTVNSIAEEQKRPDRKIENKNQFMLEYHNSVIYRSFTGGSYLTQLGRIEDEKNLRQTAIETIEHMQKNKMIKPEHQQNYTAIKDLLEKEVIK